MGAAFGHGHDDHAAELPMGIDLSAAAGQTHFSNPYQHSPPGFREEKVSTVMQKKTWAEMSSFHKAVIITLGTAEVVATTYSAVDLLRRPHAQVRGPKLLWAAALFVQPVGPLAYLTVGRIG